MTEHLLRVELVADPSSSAGARDLITEYVRWVAGVARELYGLEFDADAMIASDLAADSPFVGRYGRLYLVVRDGECVGVGGLRLLVDGAAELLRMYVRPAARGAGAGRMLLARLIDDARSLGASSVRLESLKALGEAHALYRSAGFVEIPAYETHAMAEYQPRDDMDRFCDSVLFMELRL